MTKDAAAPMILENVQNICEHSIHPLIAGRRSSHSFAPTSVEPETLASLMEAARWAPSSMNEQPWSFIVATKEHKSAFHRLLGCLVEFNIQWAQHAPVLLLSVTKLTFESTGELNRHAFHDVGQAIANLTFQATVSGLVVHQIAGFDVEKARREFSIPQHYEAVAAAAIGYPGNSAELPEKLGKRDTSPRLIGLEEYRTKRRRDRKNRAGQPATGNAGSDSRVTVEVRRACETVAKGTTATCD
jgi:nitroreductase